MSYFDAAFASVVWMVAGIMVFQWSGLAEKWDTDSYKSLKLAVIGVLLGPIAAAPVAVLLAMRVIGVAGDFFSGLIGARAFSFAVDAIALLAAAHAVYCGRHWTGAALVATLVFCWMFGTRRTAASGKGGA